MTSELFQLLTNVIWEEAVSPHGIKVVSTRLVFIFKYNSMGKLDKYKARIVTRGFT